MIFDPVNSTEIAAAVAGLALHTGNIILTADAVSRPNPSALIPPPTGPTIAGLVYRTMVATTVTLAPGPTSLSPCPLQNPPTAQSIVAVVPDTSTAYVVPAHAGAFTTSTFSFGFTNGSLTTYGNQQPSEIAAVAGIPLSIAQSVMSIPAQVLQLRVNYNTTAAALVNARSSLYQAQFNAATAAATAQTQLVQAQASLTQAQIGAPAAGINAQANLINAQAAVITAQAAALKAQQALQALQAAGAIYAPSAPPQ